MFSLTAAGAARGQTAYGEGIKMKKIDFGAIVARLLSSAWPAIGSLIASYCYLYFSISGAIDYAVSQDKQSNYFTFYVANYRSEPADIEIGLSSLIDSIVASTGTAGIEILNPAGRVGSVVSLTTIPPNSDYSFIVKTALTVPIPAPTLLRAPMGVDLRRADPSRLRINVFQILLQATLTFLLVFVALTILDKKMSVIQKDIDRNKVDLDERREEISKLRASTESIFITNKRMRAYTQTLLRHLSTENEFWRSLAEKMLSSEGASKSKARQLLAMIQKKLGLKSINNVDDQDLDLVIGMLIDEDKRKRFDELNLGHRDHRDIYP